MSLYLTRFTAVARALALFALVATLALGGCSSSTVAEPPAPSEEDVASGSAALVTAFATGSLIIPMDTTFQDNGMLKAFGLVYKLVTNDVPVAWVVQTGKSQGGV